MWSLLTLCLTYTGHILSAQTTGKIAGVVSDVNGEPLIGVNILIEDTTFGQANSGIEFGFIDIFILQAGYTHLFLKDDSGVGYYRTGFGVKVAETIIVDNDFCDRWVLCKVNSIVATFRFLRRHNGRYY